MKETDREIDEREREREKKKQSHHKRYNINNEEQLDVMLNMFGIVGSMSKNRTKYYQRLVLDGFLFFSLLCSSSFSFDFDINMSCRYATDSLINHQ